MDKKEIKKILITRYEHIGDYGLTIPIIDSIRKNFPRAKIDIAIGPWNKKFAEATFGINKIILFNNPFVKKHIKYGDILKIAIFNVWKLVRHIQELNKEDYDLLIDFSDRKYSRFFNKFIKAKRKVLGTKYLYVGEREANRMSRILFTELGIANTSKKGRLNYSNQDKKKIENLLRNIYGKKILIHPITELPEKNWPVNRWAEVIEELLNKKENNVIILGGPDDEEKIEEIIKLCKKRRRLYNFAGKTDVVQSVYLIGRADLIIGSDSGPVHWAELTSTPIITLYGPTDEKRWGPPRGQGEFIKEGGSMEDICSKEVLKRLKKFV